MGKAGIYVLLLIVVVIAVGALGYGLLWVLQKLLTGSHERHLTHLRENTPWSQYLDVSELGEYVIGVHRHAEGRTFAQVEMCRLPADHDQLEVKLKISEAKDRALIYNNERESA